MKVHVYRNRPDDDRTRGELHFCVPCNGWYGVSHVHSHCQQRRSAEAWRQQCACRFCREASGLPVEGTYGFITSAKEWQP